MTRSSRSSLEARLRVLSWSALVVMLPIVFFFTTEGTWHLMKGHTEGGWSNHFFMAQAQAMVHQRLDVARDEIRSECFDRDGRCYGYFGITPSVLRLPLLMKGRWSRSGLTPVYVGVAVLLAYWAALRLLRRFLRESSGLASPQLTFGYAVVGALLLGPGSTLLFTTRPAVYEEAIAWGVAFFMLTLDRIAAWYHTNRRRDLIFAVMFAIAAANARPSVVPACVVLGVVVIALAKLRLLRADTSAASATDDGSSTLVTSAGRRAVVGMALCLMLLPGLTASGVFWAKFRAPIPDLRLNEQVREAKWWQDILQRNGDHTFGAIFAPTELVAYLRPDAVTVSPDWPFVFFRFPSAPVLWVPPLPPDGAYVDVNQPFTSLTATMPLAAAVTLLVTLWLAVCAWRLARHRASPVWGVPMPTTLEWTLAAGLLLSAAAMVGAVVTTVGVANRYLGDFYPVAAVGVALGARVILPRLAQRPRLVAPLACAVFLLVAWSVFVMFALNYRVVFE